jgi:hypothetical protein
VLPSQGITWSWAAIWDDTKFAIKHYGDFDHIAMVGDRK